MGLHVRLEARRQAGARPCVMGGPVGERPLWQSGTLLSFPFHV